MKTVEWSSRAERQLASWIRYLVRVAGAELAERANTEVQEKAASLAQFSGHRESWWPDYQHISLGDWHKLLVYRVEGNRVIVAALYDMRQDLTRVKP